MMTRLSSWLTACLALGLSAGCSGSTAKDGGAAGSSPGAGSSSSAGGGGNTSSNGGASGGEPNSGGGSATSSAGATSLGSNSAAQVAAKLGKPAKFLIGMGNDLQNDHSMDGAYTLGTTLDLHYAYLVASLSNGVWSSWNSWDPDGSFVNQLTDSADAKGVVPMFSLWAMAAAGDGVLTGLTNDVFEKGYWDDVKLLFQRLAVFDKPAVVHLEPDFWAYAEQQSKEDPTSMKVNLKANAPDCADLSEDLVGMGHCLVKLARMYAPKVIIGFHASEWAASDPNATVAFLNKVGADQTDFIVADLLDRDAGCFEAATDPYCMRSGTFYWDESNTTSPNFHDYLAWSKAIASGLGLPVLWWQIPFGVPSTTPGGTSGHYRDNRVHYIFSHIQEFVDAGGLGAAFGTGAANQTYIDSDGGQFKTAVGGYYQSPVALP